MLIVKVMRGLIMKLNLFIVLIIFTNLRSNWAEKTLNSLNLEEKIAQLFIIKVNNSDFNQVNNNLDSVHAHIINSPEQIRREEIDNLIKKYKIGGVHLVCMGTIKSCYDAVKHFQKISVFPLLISQDFEWGLSMRLTDALNFPKNMTLGAITNENLIYQMAKEVAHQCSLLGVHINFAPVVDVNTNPLNPVINDRSFGDSKYKVARLSTQMMRGLQNGNIIACAKHFPGHGDTAIDSHKDLPVINHDFQRIENIELYPFKKLINEGVKAIMSAHIFVPAIDKRENRPITLSKNGMTNLLQKNLGFKGLIITDDLDMKGISKFYGPDKVAIEAFLAGNDLLLMSKDIEIAIKSLKNAVMNGTIHINELNRRVLKILKAKEELCLNKNRYASEFNYNNFFSPKAKLLKEKLYQSAITLVKDKNNLIPLKQNSNALTINLDSKIQINDIKKLEKLIENYQTFIINIFDLNKQDHINYSIQPFVLDFLNKLNNLNKNIILVIYGTPYSLKLFKNFKTIIMAYENNVETKNACNNIIAGKLKAKGKLPIQTTLN